MAKLASSALTTSVNSLREDRLRDAERSQATILQAAIDEFSEYGLGGARMDRMAERAGLNKRLIYYYFGDKDSLFQAVLERSYQDIRLAEHELHLEDLPPLTALKRLVEFTWTYYLDHPEFLTLLNSANLHKARHLSQPERAQALNSPLVEMLARILERGRREGSLRGGIDPIQLYISIAGLAYFYLSNSHTLGTIFNRNLLSAKARNERLSHMCDVIVGYATTAC
jgi:AcrR family transcriptional regulator